MHSTNVTFCVPVDPNFYSKNLLMLGRTYMGMQDKELALFYLTKAKEYPAHTLEDKEVQHLLFIDLSRHRSTQAM